MPNHTNKLGLIYVYENFQDWFLNHNDFFIGYPEGILQYVDKAGNVCTREEDFYRAQDQDLFPVTVTLKQLPNKK